jgi:nucleoside 2-deoxyribosyltransferase
MKLSLKLIYIAGPYGDAGGYLAIDRNIARAREVAAYLAESGVGFVCPHLNSAHFEVITPDVPHTFWYELDLRMLAACDAILLLDGWTVSNGAKQEHSKALELGLPVFYQADMAALGMWLADNRRVPA